MSNTIVNTNVAAMNSHRQILSVGGRQSRSAERLSSGMRINRAADDAAGLAISEGMRNQIRGLDQSVRNSQDGISLVQTAEGALEEVHRMGERIRQLTVQGANDTNDADDRALIDLEIQQLLEDVNRIISDTEFNGMNLLGGDIASLGERVRATAWTNFEQARGEFQIAENAFNNAISIAESTRNDQITLAQAIRDGEMAEADAVRAIAIADANSAHAASMASANSAFAASMAAANLIPTNDAAGVASQQAAIAAAELELASQTAAANSALAASTTSANNEHAASANDITAEFGSQVNAANREFASIQGAAQNDLRTAQNDLNAARVAQNLATEGMSSVGASEFGIQSGANSGQRIDIQLNNIQVYADRLNAGMWAAVQSGADISQTLDVLDEFITSISEQRANLGAYQNRLEHTINSLSITSENLSAANSRIRDTDMAAEMMQFTQANVLQQAGMSMLAQANQAPNNVLQLVG